LKDFADFDRINVIGRVPWQGFLLNLLGWIEKREACLRESA
jgi:hypothetical protein